MTEDEEQATLAYIKLQDDVKQLILQTIWEEVTKNGSIGGNITTHIIHSYQFEQRVKEVIKKQMEKF